MQEDYRQRKMVAVMAPLCRSYPSRIFDGCPDCLDAALDAVTQAGLYLLARTASGRDDSSEGPLHQTYGLRVRILDQGGTELAADELEAEQSIEAQVVAGEEPSVEIAELVTADEADPQTGMRLDDFGTVVDRLEVSTEISGCVTGSIAGSLFGFERLIGRFEIAVGPAEALTALDMKSGRPDRIRPAATL